MNTITVVTQKQGKTLSGVILSVKDSTGEGHPDWESGFSLPHSASTTCSSGRDRRNNTGPWKVWNPTWAEGVKKAEGEAADERFGWSWLVIPMAHLKQSMLEALLVPLTFILALYVHIFASILRICSSQERLQYFSTSTSYITVFYGPCSMGQSWSCTWGLGPGRTQRGTRSWPFSTMLSLPSSTPSFTVSRTRM